MLQGMSSMPETLASMCRDPRVFDGDIRTWIYMATSAITTQAEMSRETGVSPFTICRRIRRLREAGYLEKDGGKHKIVFP